MIGIAGWVDRAQAEPERSVLARMLSTLSHRGSPARMAFRGRIALGVVGLSRARRSSDLSEQEKVWIELDGRISTSGADPVPGSRESTASLAAAYAASGPEFLRRASGEFAMVLWDENVGRLLLARDPLGVKPLYYCRSGSWLGFASEIKALLQHPRTPRALDRSAVAEYVGYRYVSGSGTMFQDIRELEPGCYLVWEDGEVTTRPYWDLPYEAPGKTTPSEAEYAKRTAAILNVVIHDALWAGGRTGVLLSGGLDSSLITALALRHTSPPLRTWSVGLSGSPFDEGPRAEDVARRLGTRHVNRSIDAKEYAADLPKAIAVNDEPLHHPNSVALLLVAREAAGEVEALIMGEGADSSFGNRAALKLRLAQALEAVVPTRLLLFGCSALATAVGSRRLGLLREILEDDPGHFALTSNLFTPSEVVRELLGIASDDPILASRRHYVAEPAGRAAMARLLYYYQKTELVASFNVFGKMLTASGVAARMPFGARSLQELSCRVPLAMKASLRGRAKPLLVRVARTCLPDEVVNWPKRSFGFPIGEWFRRGQPLEPYLRLLLGPDALTRDLFRPAALSRIIAENEQGFGNHGEGALWTAVNLELWTRIHLNGQSPEAVLDEARAMPALTASR